MTDKEQIRAALTTCVHEDREYAENFFREGIGNWPSDTIRSYADSYFPERSFDGVTESDMIEALALEYADSAVALAGEAETLVNRVTDNWLDETWENYAELAPAAPAAP
jgi:hypothetical protein